MAPLFELSIARTRTNQVQAVADQLDTHGEDAQDITLQQAMAPPLEENLEKYNDPDRRCPVRNRGPLEGFE